jgi:hypothetical protein
MYKNIYIFTDISLGVLEKFGDETPVEQRLKVFKKYKLFKKSLMSRRVFYDVSFILLTKNCNLKPDNWWDMEGRGF